MLETIAIFSNVQPQIQPHLFILVANIVFPRVEFEPSVSLKRVRRYGYGLIMRVLIADDNELVRRGIAKLLSGDQELEICGEASNSSETLQKADELMRISFCWISACLE